MSTIKSDVEKLVQKELESANQRFPMFRSDHEGAAVIVEEIEETKDSLIDTEYQFGEMWKCIKDNMSGYPFIERLYVCAIEAACEAIQVAAMAQKFIDSQKEREENEDN